MKIYFHYNATDAPWGGGNSFLKALRKEFIENDIYGIRVASHINELYDIFFVSGVQKAPGHPIKIREIRNIKKWGYHSGLSYLWNGLKMQSKKIILRLDGTRKVYAGRDDGMYFVQRQCIRLADRIIFQSRFCVETFKDVPFDSRSCTIIHNGVDQKIFFLPLGIRKLSTPIKIVSASWSSNPMKGHQVIASFSELSDVEVTYVGNWPSGIDRKYVTIIPPQHQTELAKIFLKHHIFLFPSRNDACPNIVLEALSCGLPLLYENSGGTPEIASAYGMALTGNPTDDLMSITDRYRELQEAIWRDRETFSIARAASSYSEAFRAAVNSA